MIEDNILEQSPETKPSPETKANNINIINDNDNDNDNDNIINNDIINDIINDVKSKNENKAKRGRKSKKDIEREAIEREKNLKIQIAMQLEVANIFINKFTKPLTDYEIKQLVNSLYRVLKKHNITEFDNIPFYDEINLLITLLMIVLARKN